jgi:hypothetical protein
MTLSLDFVNDEEWVSTTVRRGVNSAGGEGGASKPTSALLRGNFPSA